MAQRAYWPIAATLVFIGAALPAHAGLFGGDDTLQSVTADCGSPDLSADSVDSCLERIRVLSETDPSPELEALDAQIERRADEAEDGTAAPAKSAPKTLPGTAVTNTLPQSPAADPAPTTQPPADHPTAPAEKAAPGNASPAATAENDPPVEIEGDDDPPPVEDKDDDRADPPPMPHAQLY